MDASILIMIHAGIILIDLSELWSIAPNGTCESVSQSMCDDPRYRAVFTAKKYNLQKVNMNYHSKSKASSLKIE